MLEASGDIILSVGRDLDVSDSGRLVSTQQTKAKWFVNVRRTYTSFEFLMTDHRSGRLFVYLD